jgi:hypothetical protein
MVLLVTLDGGKKIIVDLPEGGHPPSVFAEINEALTYDVCDSEEEARRRMAKDPNSKPI